MNCKIDERVKRLKNICAFHRRSVSKGKEGMRLNMEEILNYFPSNIRNIIFEEVKDKYETLEEIRLRMNRPIILKFIDNEKVIKYSINAEEINTTLQAICENSIYTYQNEIAEGFITIKGGNRVGISGSCVIEDGKVININYIYSLNFRIAREIIGAGNRILKFILDSESNSIYNTLIVSKPGAGKTTAIRDIIRQLSSGIKDIKFLAINVGIVDERGEIAALYKGNPENDIGIKTDVVENVSKSKGLEMLIRSMAPKVVVADEIGKQEDIEAIKYAICSGCKGLFTAHGSSFEDISLNPIIKNLISEGILERIVFLDDNSKGRVREAYKLNKKLGEYEKMVSKV